MLLQPKNWGTFQHYKDRCPPWIKLHRDLLINREFMRLPLASKAIAPLLWLLASESKDGIFNGSADELQFRLHLSTKDIQDGLKPLIDKGFFVVASALLADCKQVAIAETETETETETELETKKETETKKEKKATEVACAPDVFPEGLDVQAWERWTAYRKEIGKPLKPASIAAAEQAFIRYGDQQAAVVEQSIANGWQGLFALKAGQAGGTANKRASESFYERDQRLKAQTVAQFAPGIAARTSETFENFTGDNNDTSIESN